MNRFLQRFALLVAGVLQGFDRLVFKGKLCPLYSPEGMNCLLCANQVPYKDFKQYAASVTAQVLQASLVAEAKALGRYQYLKSSKSDKEQVARTIAQQHGVTSGLVCVLQCVEPCWTFDKARTEDGHVRVRGEPGKCSHLYHYYLHPQFGWLYVRLQTWFPFEMQVGLNGREWLARQLDLAKIPYLRSDNKILDVADWHQAQQLLDQQVQTDWVRELDALQHQVHPVHPRHLDRLPRKYNWTAFQTEWATDIAFRSPDVLAAWFDRWLRQALTYDSSDLLRFFGRSRPVPQGDLAVETSVHNHFEGKRIKYWVGHNSLKLYTHANVLRPETTINKPEEIRVLRPPADLPAQPPRGRRPRIRMARRQRATWRPMRRTVVDMPQRATFSQEVNGRYLEALASTDETRTLQELAEPLTRRVPEPRQPCDQPLRHVRGLNPLAASDAALLVAISDPRWLLNGLRNRDLVAALYPTEPADAQERRRRSARVTRLLRMLRAHGLLEKISGSHRYQLSPDASTKVQALLACYNANPDKLITNAA
jgi:hypothetical protein